MFENGSDEGKVASCNSFVYGSRLIYVLRIRYCHSMDSEIPVIWLNQLIAQNSSAFFLMSFNATDLERGALNLTEVTERTFLFSPEAKRYVSREPRGLPELNPKKSKQSGSSSFSVRSKRSTYGTEMVVRT